MRSRANFKSHPLHPILIVFPFAFLTGGTLIDIAARIFWEPGWAATAETLLLLGIVSALVAALPGFVDFLSIVPPGSSAHRRALVHMTVNLTAVVLFTFAYLLRTAAMPGSVGILGMELAAVGLLSAGGWMGGTLVYRNQIGVDHRYARAGKWRETRGELGPDGMIPVGRASDLQAGQMLLAHAGGRRIVVGRTDEGLVAFDDRCTHRGGPLSDGVLACHLVQCPWHGSQFDVRTGAVHAGPATDKIRTYGVQERNGELYVQVGGEEGR
jgi:nitrite reductase/ring-hydroxylating ferredoxin subunit/uncharacterized membrane protein